MWYHHKIPIQHFKSQFFQNSRMPDCTEVTVRVCVRNNSRRRKILSSECQLNLIPFKGNLMSEECKTASFRSFQRGKIEKSKEVENKKEFY